MKVSHTESLPETYRPITCLVFKQNNSEPVGGFIILEVKNSFMVLLITLRETWESMNNTNDCISQLQSFITFDEANMSFTEEIHVLSFL